MRVLRLIASRDEIASIAIPPEFGDEVEVIILPAQEEDAQSTCEPSDAISNDAAEDVQNTTEPPPSTPQDR
jgi:hypothetical protein